MKRFLGGLLLALIPHVSAFAAGSTINPGIPAANSQFQSAPVRNNFAAAANDINNILTSFAGPLAPSNPAIFQSWMDTSAPASPLIEKRWDGTQWIPVWKVDTSAHTATPIGMSAPDVAFTQSGTGAVQRTVRDKSAETISITDFGASSALADNSANVQAAITYVLSLPRGGSVYVPAPTSGTCYVIDAQVSIPKTVGKTVVMYGDGAASCFSNGATIGNTPMMYVGSAVTAADGSGVTLRNIAFNGRTTGAGNALKLENANGTLIENLRFNGLYLPVQMVSSFGVTFSKNVWDTTASYAVYSSTIAHHTTFQGNWFYNTGTSGASTIQVDQASGNLVFRDNDAETGWTFLSLAGGTALTFEGNYVEYFSNTPIYFSATMSGASISNNWIALSGALALSNLSGGRFENNSAYNQNIGLGTATNVAAKSNTVTGTGSTVTDGYFGTFTANGFKAYKTPIGAADGEWAEVTWNSNELWIGTNKTGSGSGWPIAFLSGGTRVWSIPTSGHFLPYVDKHIRYRRVREAGPQSIQRRISHARQCVSHACRWRIRDRENQRIRICPRSGRGETCDRLRDEFRHGKDHRLCRHIDDARHCR